MNEVERLKEIVETQEKLLDCKERIIEQQSKMIKSQEEIISLCRAFLVGLRNVVQEGYNAYYSNEESDSR